MMYRKRGNITIYVEWILRFEDFMSLSNPLLRMKLTRRDDPWWEGSSILFQWYPMRCLWDSNFLVVNVWTCSWWILVMDSCHFDQVVPIMSTCSLYEEYDMARIHCEYPRHRSLAGLLTLIQYQGLDDT